MIPNTLFLEKMRNNWSGSRLGFGGAASGSLGSVTSHSWLVRTLMVTPRGNFER